MIRLAEGDAELVEGVVEFLGYMAERTENSEIKDALAEGEAKWAEVLDSDRKESAS